ncbi:hypothetical protein GCM10010286_19160 [Streptomyces toxytricini]|nr:hypothetical protein GCM10010286_19160 [Streptomyces toxytricini]
MGSPLRGRQTWGIGRGTGPDRRHGAAGADRDPAATGTDPDGLPGAPAAPVRPGSGVKAATCFLVIHSHL